MKKVQALLAMNKERKSDSLNEYSDKEPMTPAKINTGEPMAVKKRLE